MFVPLFIHPLTHPPQPHDAGRRPTSEPLLPPAPGRAPRSPGALPGRGPAAAAGGRGRRVVCDHDRMLARELTWAGEVRSCAHIACAHARHVRTSPESSLICTHQNRASTGARARAKAQKRRYRCVCARAHFCIPGRTRSSAKSAKSEHAHKLQQICAHRCTRPQAHGPSSLTHASKNARGARVRARKNDEAARAHARAQICTRARMHALVCTSTSILRKNDCARTPAE